MNTRRYEKPDKGKNVVGSEDLAKTLGNANLNAEDDGEWAVISRKSKNKNAKAWAPNNSTKSWVNPEANQRRARGNAEGSNANQWGNENRSSYRPPLQNGWNWQGRKGNDEQRTHSESTTNQSTIADEENEENDEDELLDENDDDDELLSDDFDSDTAEQSYETRKANKWFKKFFEIFEKLTLDQINEPARQWHCPACQRGPGAIDWYRGLLPLITHAKTKGSKRIKLHREFAELLEEELRRRGTSALPNSEAFGKWKGLQEDGKDHEIVWPPMVIIMNTRLEKDDNEKWIGMGNQELLDYFNEYAAIKSRHSYGPSGHRGMSALIFESSATGYFEAERLHKHFADQRTDRNAWETRRVLFLPGGKRQLYGYMAIKEDIEVFNQHSPGKSKLKYDMRSYNEMVVRQIRQMHEDNQELVWLKDKVVKEKMHSKAWKESFGQVSEKLRSVMEESRIVRQRTQMHNDQRKEEMNYQEQFLKDHLELIYDKREEKEEGFEMMQQEKRDKVMQDNSGGEDYRTRAQEIHKFIRFQDKEIEEFVGERDRLVKEFDGKRNEMRRRHWEEEVALEKEFDALLDHLMDSYSSHQ